MAVGWAVDGEWHAIPRRARNSPCLLAILKTVRVACLGRAMGRHVRLCSSKARQLAGALNTTTGVRPPRQRPAPFLRRLIEEEKM